MEVEGSTLYCGSLLEQQHPWFLTCSSPQHFGCVPADKPGTHRPYMLPWSRRSYEDVYGDPGSPLPRRTKAGTYILAKVGSSWHHGKHACVEGVNRQGSLPTFITPTSTTSAAVAGSFCDLLLGAHSVQPCPHL